MCWGIGVFLRVLANLTNRICSDISDGLQRMCSICFCWVGGSGSNVHPMTAGWYKARNQVSSILCDFFVEYTESGYKDEFYKDVDRETAEEMLGQRQDGTFLVRPSTATDSVGTLSVVQDERTFHLTIRRRRTDGRLALGTPKPRERTFDGLDSMINYHVSNYLVLFSHNRTFYTLLLPYTAARKLD
ncbi:PREDICTED: uncharacterized protein LOC108558150 [Nicrophorus vespilloides]|uniref:Uncharacterized protein LOC108558150 n=1 Tax=Nicrophorus vespilloides TaxID=110193 RepID=A0ABM1M7A9_NICVS|nr:PREDICTED: uncharacterized protein LOC108558150 [Nicrophorus vespilloides]